jgi:hypothetical protein
MIMLYHKNSFNYYINIMFIRRLGVHLLRFNHGPSLISRLTGEDINRLREMQTLYRDSKSQLLAPDEFLSRNTDGAGNPLARAYTKRLASELFSMFESVRTEVHFLNKRWIPLLGKIMPRTIEKAIAGICGWHLWIFAYKSSQPIKR